MLICSQMHRLRDGLYNSCEMPASAFRTHYIYRFSYKITFLELDYATSAKCLFRHFTPFNG
jgi:hypothetical protein